MDKNEIIRELLDALRVCQEYLVEDCNCDLCVTLSKRIQQAFDKAQGYDQENA